MPLQVCWAALVLEERLPRPLIRACARRLRLPLHSPPPAVDLKDGSKWGGFRSLLSNSGGGGGQHLQQLLANLQPDGEQDAALVREHIWEGLAVAWGAHETLGEFTTAALAWLESGGRADLRQLLRQYAPLASAARAQARALPGNSTA